MQILFELPFVISPLVFAYIETSKTKTIGTDEMNMFFPEGILYQTAKNQKFLQTPEGLQEAMSEDRVLEARAILCDNEHNLWVDLPCGKGMIPRTEGALGIAEGTVRDIALIARVNRPVCFTVTSITTDQNGEPLAFLSRRAVQEKCRRNYISTLLPGDVIDVAITHLEPFGAFCDIGCGLPSFIPIDNISVSRIFHPADRFQVGQHIKAVVKELLPDGKISLTHKELLGTWEENAALFQAGETVSGMIRTVESYGSFVELTPNLAGLAEPKEGIVPGQQAAVFIKNIIPEKMKIKLIIVDAFSAPREQNAPEYYFQGNHMNRWQYSPPGCHKTIVTEFEEYL